MMTREQVEGAYQCPFCKLATPHRHEELDSDFNDDMRVVHFERLIASDGWEFRRFKEWICRHDAALRQQLEEIKIERDRWYLAAQDRMRIMNEMEHYEGQLRTDLATAERRFTDSQQLLLKANRDYDALQIVAQGEARENQALQATLQSALCGESLCGHDHSTQYWELRANNAEQQLADLQRQLVETQAVRDKLMLSQCEDPQIDSGGNRYCGSIYLLEERLAEAQARILELEAPSRVD